MNVKVSYILPTFNKEMYIEHSLTSIINQWRGDSPTRPRLPTLSTDQIDLEIIVVDDDSADNSMDIAGQVLEKADITYTILPLPKNKGLGNALWEGFRKATGEYLCYLSPDDYLLDPKKTWKQVMEMESNLKTDVTFFNAYIAGETLEKGKVIKLPLEYNYILQRQNLCFVGLMHKNVIGSTSLMFRASSYFRLGEWDYKLGNTANDGDLMFRYLLNGANISMIDGIAMFYRVYKDQMSAGADFYKKTNEINDKYKKIVYDGDYPSWMKHALKLIPRQRY